MSGDEPRVPRPFAPVRLMETALRVAVSLSIGVVLLIALAIPIKITSALRKDTPSESRSGAACGIGQDKITIERRGIDPIHIKDRGRTFVPSILKQDFAAGQSQFKDLYPEVLAYFRSVPVGMSLFYDRLLGYVQMPTHLLQSIQRIDVCARRDRTIPYFNVLVVDAS